MTISTQTLSSITRNHMTDISHYTSLAITSIHGMLASDLLDVDLLHLLFLLLYSRYVDLDDSILILGRELVDIHIIR